MPKNNVDLTGDTKIMPDLARDIANRMKASANIDTKDIADRMKTPKDADTKDIADKMKTSEDTDTPAETKEAEEAGRTAEKAEASEEIAEQDNESVETADTPEAPTPDISTPEVPPTEAPASEIPAPVSDDSVEDKKPAAVLKLLKGKIRLPENWEKGEKEEAAAGRYKSELFNWGESLISVLIFFVIIFIFFVRLIGVDGSSMYPTLEDHNVMLTSNWNYEPARGDIVVLNKESFWNGLPIVKRIIAIGGDEIDIDFAAGVVFVNGEALDEPYVAEPTHKQEDMTFPQVVPEGCVFVMGDNRNASTDSRNSALGMVDERYILGHVLTIVYPFNKIGAL